MTRRAWAAAIFAVWGVGLGWLAKREFFRPTGARLAEAARAIPPGATFYRLDLAGHQIGFASSTVDTMGDSIRVDEALVLEVPTLGRLSRTTARSTAVVGRTLRLRSVNVVFDGDLGRFTARGEVTDSVLRIVLVSAGDTQTSRVSLLRPIVIPALLPLRVAFGGRLEPGATRTARVFDPWLLTEHDVGVTVVRESTLTVADSADFDSTAMAWVPVRFDTVPSFRLDVASEGLSTSMWVDAQGRVVRSANSRGFTAERSAFEIAYENFRRRDTTRLVAAAARSASDRIAAVTAIAAGRPLPATELRELRLRLDGGEPAGLGPASPRQHVMGDTVVIRREPDALLRASYRLPHAPESAFAAWLAPEPLIQSENPRIRAQARLLVNRLRDPGLAAERLVRWVHEVLRREVTDAVPNAVQAFETRRGDANEHAVLLVALARAAGLPARTAAGLLYLDGRFYYHAWAEVYLRDWVAVDPTLGQFPADAARLKLVTGGLARQIELLELVGTLNIEVL